MASMMDLPSALVHLSWIWDLDLAIRLDTLIIESGLNSSFRLFAISDLIIDSMLFSDRTGCGASSSFSFASKSSPVCVLLIGTDVLLIVISVLLIELSVLIESGVFSVLLVPIRCVSPTLAGRYSSLNVTSRRQTTTCLLGT